MSHDYPLFWRTPEATEEEVINPLAKEADKAQMKLEGLLRRWRTRTEIEFRRRIRS